MGHTLNDISIIPSVNGLKNKLQSLAMLDAILMQDWEMRYFSFNSEWGPGEMMASMRDGQGSEFFFLFNTAGAAGKIYSKGNALDSDSALKLAQVPADFSSFLGESAFSLDVATCYLWQRLEEGHWSVAPKSINEIPFLAFVADQGEHYCAWARDYYEIELKSELVTAMFRGDPLTPALVISINPEIEMEQVLADCLEIGYPQ